MEGESVVTRSIIDELYFSDIQGDQIERECCLTRSITNELHSWYIQRDQMEGESFDGQYLHFSILAHLTEALYLSDQFNFSWDPLLKWGVLDNHIREDSSFS